MYGDNACISQSCFPVQFFKYFQLLASVMYQNVCNGFFFLPYFTSLSLLSLSLFVCVVKKKKSLLFLLPSCSFNLFVLVPLLFVPVSLLLVHNTQPILFYFYSIPCSPVSSLKTSILYIRALIFIIISYRRSNKQP